MALAHVQTVGGGSTASGQASFTSAAASFTAGNLLLALITWSTSSAAPSSISTPTGWTQLAFKANGAPNGASAVYSLPNNPGGSQSWTWTETGGSALGWSYTILEWSGAPTSSVLDLAVTSSATGATSSTTHDPGAATGTTAAGDLLISFFGLNRSTPPTITIASTSNPTSGWTVDTQYNSTGGTVNAGSVAAYQIVTGTVTSPDCIGTSSTVSSGEAFFVTILAAGGGTTVSSGVINVGGQGDLFMAGSVDAVIASAIDLGGAGGSALPDLGLGGGGGLAAPDLALGGSGGLLATGALVVRSGVVGMGGGGGQKLPDLGMGGKGDMRPLDRGMGGGGDLLVTGTTIIASGVVNTGDAGAGLASVVAALTIGSSVVSMGSVGDGLAPFTGLVLDRPSQFPVGDNGSGLLVTGLITAISSGVITMGGGAGIAATGNTTLPSGVQFGSNGAGLASVVGFSGYPNGHWVSAVVWIWRQQSPGVYGWNLVKVHRWLASNTWANLS